MKKVFALLLALVMVLSMAACGGSGDPGKEPENNNATAPATKPNENPDPVVTTTVPADDLISYEFSQFGKARVTIVGAEFGEDDYGDPFLRIYYDYTNTDDTAAGHTPLYALTWTAVQNGEELYDLTFDYEDDVGAVADDLLSGIAVQPGITVRQTALFYCSPDDGVIDLSCYLMVSSAMFNEEDLLRMEFQVDPADLMGAPEAYEIQTISDPHYTDGMPTSGSSDASVPFTISLNGYELTTYDEMPALRVCMTYTNDADGAWPAGVAVPIVAYQDGISLERVDTWYLDDATEADEAFDTDTEPGETVECNAIFLLRGDSPVEVVIEQPLDALRAGMCCEVD